jgi:hypothetical protein
MKTKKEELVELIGQHSLPFCDEVYALATAMLKWHEDEMDKNLADIRNKMGPINNLVALVSNKDFVRGDPDSPEYSTVVYINDEAKRCKKAIKYICQK